MTPSKPRWMLPRVLRRTCLIARLLAWLGSGLGLGLGRVRVRVRVRLGLGLGLDVARHRAQQLARVEWPLEHVVVLLHEHVRRAHLPRRKRNQPTATGASRYLSTCEPRYAKQVTAQQEPGRLGCRRSAQGTAHAQHTHNTAQLYIRTTHYRLTHSTRVGRGYGWGQAQG